MTENNSKIIRIGTRGSKLALAQAHLVRDKILSLNKHLKAEIVEIKTTGDMILEKNLYEIGGKGLFIKEIEEKLLDNTIDIAVHSMKDMPAFYHEDLIINCILEREDARDALISQKAKTIMELPQGAIVGTSSPRRSSQALNLRPDLKIVPFRGNIHTRLEKLNSNAVDATFLAMAGLNRSGIKDKTIHPIATSVCLPAVAQGAIGIEILKSRKDLNELLAPMHHEKTGLCVSAERAFLKEFEGSCKTPIAALAVIDGNRLQLECLIASMDGQTILKTSRNGETKDADKLGKDAALELLAKAGKGFFE